MASANRTGRPERTGPCRLRWLALLAGWLLLSLGLAAILFLGSSRTARGGQPRRRGQPDAVAARSCCTPGRCCPTCGCRPAAASASTSCSARPRPPPPRSWCSATRSSPASPKARSAAVEARRVRTWRCPRPCAAPCSGCVPVGAVAAHRPRAAGAELARGRAEPARARGGRGRWGCSRCCCWCSRGTGPAPGPRTRRDWTPLAEFAGDVPLPAELSGVEMTTDVMTTETRRLVLSAIDHLRHEQGVVRRGRRPRPPSLELRQPLDGETVALVVSRPARQHRHGPGGPRGRRRRRGHRRPRRR